MPRSSARRSTTDKVFLLSAREVNKYFPQERDRICKASAYAKEHGAEIEAGPNQCRWWLRSPAVTMMGLSGWAPSISADGSGKGWGIYSNETCVRPVIRVKSSKFTTGSSSAVSATHSNQAKQPKATESEKKAEPAAESKQKPATPKPAAPKPKERKYGWIGDIIPEGADQAEIEKELEAMSDEDAQATISMMRQLKDLDGQVSNLKNMVDQAQKEEEERAEIERHEAEEQTRREAAEKAQHEVEEKTRLEAEEKERLEVQHRMVQGADNSKASDIEPGHLSKDPSFQNDLDNAIAKEAEKQFSINNSNLQTKGNALFSNHGIENAGGNTKSERSQVTETVSGNREASNKEDEQTRRYEKRIKQIQEEIDALDEEYEEISGLFGFSKRKKIEKRIEELDKEAKTLERIIELKDIIASLKEDAEKTQGLFAKRKKNKIEDEIGELEEELKELLESVE